MADLVDSRSHKSDSRKRRISSGDEDYQMARNYNDFKKENKKRSDEGPSSKKKRKELAMEEYRKNRNGIVIQYVVCMTLSNSILSPLTLLGFSTRV